MGYPNHALVPIAVLHDNPGINKEEFAELLLQTNVYTGEIPRLLLVDADWRGFKFKNIPRKTDPTGFFQEFRQVKLTRKQQNTIIRKANLKRWDNRDLEYFNRGQSAHFVHEGLFGLAEILGLENTEEYKTNTRPNNYPYRIQSVFMGEGEDRSLGFILHWYKRKNKGFQNLDSMTDKYPWLHPERIFDFSRKSGHFQNRVAEDFPMYKWNQRDGKYYLDKDHMMETTHTGLDQSFETYCQPCGYTDFIVTLEAVRNKAWKLLSYRGLQHLENFFKKWPDAKIAYEKAVIDSHTSLYAKQQGMTHNELLRFRLTAGIDEIERQTSNFRLSRPIDGD